MPSPKNNIQTDALSEEQQLIDLISDFTSRIQQISLLKHTVLINLNNPQGSFIYFNQLEKLKQDAENTVLRLRKRLIAIQSADIFVGSDSQDLLTP